MGTQATKSSDVEPPITPRETRERKTEGSGGSGGSGGQWEGEGGGEAAWGASGPHIDEGFWAADSVQIWSGRMV